MQCFQHRGNSAIGVCKACHKAVCITCVIDTGRGLACSDACVEEIRAINEVLDRRIQQYRVPRPA